ncbi:hypothetical protein BDF14DRAFT_1744386 [Spinellus fusiger]|nr:hypothetical protein BDF14DRAFT_1744386 [Spinellus fusiger]
MTVLQHTPVVINAQQEEEEVALATYLTNKMRIDQASSANTQDIWNYQPQPTAADWSLQPTYAPSGPYYPPYQSHPVYPTPAMNLPNKPQRPHTSSRSHPRTNSNSNTSREVLQVKKSTSTPLPTQRTRDRTTPGAHPRRREENRPSKPMQDSRTPPGPPSYHSGSASGSVVSISTSITSTLASDPRRSSVTSLSSSATQFSAQSEMTDRKSFSKRLRKVFSMSSIRSKDIAPDSANHHTQFSSLDSVSEHQSSEKNPSLRRRSLASLSSLFQKQPMPTKTCSTSHTSLSRRHSLGDLDQILETEDKRSRPSLRVNTEQPTPKRSVMKASPGVSCWVESHSSFLAPNRSAPDSPNSAMSSRSSSRLPPPQRLTTHDLPSPTPSSSSSSTHPRLPNHTAATEEDTAEKPRLGIHYGLAMHGSPRLKPASTSNSSLALSEQTQAMSRRRLVFCPTIQCHETFAASDYDRRCDNNATCQRLTPLLAMKIKQELNEYKLTEMEVHVESRQFTHFFL